MDVLVGSHGGLYCVSSAGAHVVEPAINGGSFDGTGYESLPVAASAFLAEYESYRTGDAVSFAPSPEVLEAFRKAVKGQS